MPLLKIEVMIQTNSFRMMRFSRIWIILASYGFCKTFTEDDIGHYAKAQVTLCRSCGPDLYDLKNRGHRHGRLMKSWQHRTDILEVCSVGKRSAVIGKPVRQSFTVKLCRVGRDCGTIYSWIDFSRVWNRKRRGTVVPNVRAFVDSVWAFVDSVRMVVKIGPI